jgi:hypothetical protein
MERGPNECDDRIRADIGYSRPQSRRLTIHQLCPTRRCGELALDNDIVNSGNDECQSPRISRIGIMLPDQLKRKWLQ